MASVPIVASKFEIGRVIGETFSGIKRNWAVLTVLSAGVAVASALLNVMVLRRLVDVAALQTNPAAMFLSPGYWVTVTGGAFLNAFASSALLTVLVGKGKALPDAISGGVRFFLPMLALMLLWTIGVSIGMMLLIVPGIILATMWSVSTPALVAENMGVFGAFGRSRALTKGIRWNVFGALLVFAIVFYVIIFAIQGLGGGSMTLFSNTAMAFFVAMTTSIFFTLLIPSFLAVLYVEAVNAKDGGSRSELAEIFN
ncbi:MAG: YciC family protein [Sphingomonadales bacterium]